ncbi:hypothetical protein GCM10020216_087620 [Nonomuraea helvata]
MDAGIACAAILTLDIVRRSQRPPPAEDGADHSPVTAHPTAEDSQTRVESADDGQSPPTEDG